MDRILAFIRAYTNLLLFLALQATGVFILANYNDRHSLLFQDMSLAISGQVNTWNASLYSYFDLSNQNEKLVQENQQLRQQLLGLQNKVYAYQNRIPLARAYVATPDSLLPAYQFNFVPARAVGNSTTSHYNYMLLNAGRRHGVSTNMGVISSEGVAGTVINVGEDYAVALSLLNKDFRLSAKVVRRGVFGTLSWQGGSTSEAYLDYVPLHIPVQVGDTVATSAHSTLFPEDVVVGRISAVSSGEQGGFHHIRVQLATDFHRLDYLYLVQHKHKAQQDSLLRPFIGKQ